MERYARMYPCCESCASNRQIDVHHVRSRMALGKAGDVPENFLSLCRGCHQRIHQVGPRLFGAENGWLMEKIQGADKLRPVLG